MPASMKDDTGNRGRRRVLGLLALTAAAAALWKLRPLGSRGLRTVQRSRVLMGTGVQLTVVGDDREAAAAAVEATLDRMADLERLLSLYRDDSEVSRLNATGSLTEASDALLAVLGLAERISGLGDGAFDVTVQPLVELYRAQAKRGALPGPDALGPVLERVGHGALRVAGRTVTFERPGMGITLDGIGKGYVVDAGVAVLKRHGFPNVFVDAGGDLVAAGTRGGGDAWRIGIRNPRPGLALHARFDALDCAAATSGDYMQPFTPDYALHHILDPRRGTSAPELASATVIAEDAATADALATLVMVVGPRAGRELLEDLPGCEGYLVAKDLQVTRTTGFHVREA